MKHWKRNIHNQQNIALSRFLQRQPKQKNWPAWIQAISAVLTVLVMLFILYVTNRANRILENSAETSNRIQLEIRRHQIKPTLRLTSKRVGIGNNEASGIVITFINIGTGAAKDIVIMIQEGNKPNPFPFQSFFPKGTFPILKPPQIQNIPLTKDMKRLIDLRYMTPVVPDTGSEQNFIRPGEELEFQYGCYEFGKTPVIFPMNLVISYYDIDGNEYTTVTKLVPGFGHVPSQYQFGHPIFDTLRKLTDKVDLYHYKTFLNLGLRDSAGIFKYTPSTDDSTVRN